MAKNTQERIAAIKHEIDRLRAYNEIQNLVAKYMNVHTHVTMDQSVECFALKQPDVSVEIAMWGKLVGPENVKRMYTGGPDKKEPMPGGMVEHQLNTRSSRWPRTARRPRVCGFPAAMRHIRAKQQPNREEN